MLRQVIIGPAPAPPTSRNRSYRRPWPFDRAAAAGQPVLRDRATSRSCGSIPPKLYQIQLRVLERVHELVGEDQPPLLLRPFSLGNAKTCLVRAE